MKGNYYLEAADKISDLAEEYSHDYDLSNILRAGAVRIMELSGSFIIKKASLDKKDQDIQLDDKCE